MEQKGLISWIIIGGLAGWMASKFMETDKSQGVFINIVVGIIGAFIGGFVMNLIGGQGVTGFNLWSFIVSLIGSIIFLWILKMIRK